MSEHDLLVAPSLDEAGLYTTIEALDQDGKPISLNAVSERMLTIFLNGREVVTVMTIGDHPEDLALGFLLNQRMIEPGDEVFEVRHDPENGAVMVRAGREVVENGEPVRRIHTSGCAVGTMFGGVMESLDDVRLETRERFEAAGVARMIADIEAIESLRNTTGALHRCVLCLDGAPAVYMEDVGRHNALDKIAGYMFRNRLPKGVAAIYTTGRLTSEVVIKTVIMGVPMLVSRSGFTELGLELALKTNLTLIARCRGRRFQVLAGAERLVFEKRPVESDGSLSG